MHTPFPARHAPEADDQRRGWLDDRLDLGALYRKYGRKMFPVHSTFFLGEMALFSFIILILTGAYLGFVYVPSNIDVTLGKQADTVPEAYASVSLIESIPVANLFRNVHHWAAHLMIASILLHLLRVYFTGSYRRPREVNWVVGAVLLGLSLMAGFVGYALPYDAYAVTATGIGYSIARSIPWIGDFASELFFGGAFPSLGSLSRLYTIHVFVLPAMITAIIGLHLTIIVKQKHTQPGYARPIAEPGKVLGVPLMPYQALLAGQLLLLMFGALFLLSAFVAPHPLEAFGPPHAATPEVKPDWYLLWVYGFLKILPSWATFHLFGATFGADFLGGLLFPALVFGVLTLAPWMDRTNRRAVRRFEYLEPVRQSPIRTAAGVATLTFLGMLFVAAYYDELGLTLWQIWLLVIGVPIGAGILVAALLAIPEIGERFDPHGAPLPMTEVAVPVAEATGGPHSPTIQARRGSRSVLVRDDISALLDELGSLGPVITRADSDEDLKAVLGQIDVLRASLATTTVELHDTIDGRDAEREE
jgi:cytochrome b-561